MNLVPGLKLRASEEAEVLGMDDAEIGEFAYDYVELTRDVVSGDALVAEDGESKFSEDAMGGGEASTVDGGGVEKAFGGGAGAGSLGFGSSTMGGEEERALNAPMGSGRRRGGG